MNTRSRFVSAVVVAAAFFVAGCSDNSSDAGGESGSAGVSAPSIAAETASFDLAAGVEQRYLLGLFATDGGSIVDGDITLEFETVDDGPLARIEEVSASFVPVAGTEQRDGDPHVAAPGEGTGAYEAQRVRFDRAGNWQVTATVDVDEETVTVTDAFEVLSERVVPAPGDPAPRSTNHLVGAPDVNPESIDSRAADGEVPDPDLHAVTVADAVASGRPTLVVVSTPTYCVSRFCGPITEEVEALHGDYGDAVNFVHLEVWENYEESVVTKAAAEWIFPDGADGGGGNEPWVFLIGADGVITHRWDNVTNAEQLRVGLDSLL